MITQHKQAAKAVIEAIRANSAITEAEAEAIVDGYFPGHGAQYLSWYVNTYYRFACTDNDTFASTRKRIANLPIKQYEIAKNKLARLAAEKAVNRITKDTLQATLSTIEAETRLHQPKTTPDSTTLEFFNANGPEANILRDLEVHKIRVEQMIAEYED